MARRTNFEKPTRSQRKRSGKKLEAARAKTAYRLAGKRTFAS